MLIPSKNESWTFDSDNEFLAAYADSDFKILIITNMEMRRMSVVDFDGRDPTVKVSGPNRGDIEEIFNIFEEAACQNSLLPGKAASQPESVPDLKSFRSETPIPSVYVNRKLLEKIEVYCLEELPKIAHVGAEKIRAKLFCSHKKEYSFGTERLERVSDQDPCLIFFLTPLPELLLRSATFSQTFGYLKIVTSIFLWLICSRDKAFSKVHVNCKAENPRETVIGIRDGLMRRINEAKTLSYIYHPPEWFNGLLFGIAFGGLFFFYKSRRRRSRVCQGKQSGLNDLVLRVISADHLPYNC